MFSGRQRKPCAPFWRHLVSTPSRPLLNILNEGGGKQRAEGCSQAFLKIRGGKGDAPGKADWTSSEGGLYLIGTEGLLAPK